MDKMNILHITDIANPNGNGVAVAVSEYLKHENNYCNVAVYNLCSDIISDGVKYFNFNDFKMISDLQEPFNKPNLVVFNEVYKPKYIKLYQECLRRKIPYVIIPHGCLVKEAQSHKRLKKIIGNFLLFNKFISNASAIQFLNEREKNNSSFKYKKYIVSGNGIDISECGVNKPTNKSLVFIGRYDVYIKGLDLLIEICKDNKDWFLSNSVDIQLYGRSSGDGLKVLHNLVNVNGVSDIIKINDAVYDNEKKKVLENSYGFIQLSRHEGQPMGIIEALGYGLPCVVTYGTSFGEFVNQNDCGYGCYFDKVEVFKNIKKIYENKNSRDIMSDNAFNSVSNSFDWQKIEESLLDEYKKLL